MADSFLPAMEEWRGELERELEKYWWGPAVGVLISVVFGVVEHRFYSDINAYIDAHWMASIVAVSSAVSLTAAVAFLFVLMPLLAIVIHAYLVSRHTDEITAEFVRTGMFPSDWAIPMTMDVMEQAGMKGELFPFDLLYEIYVVNRGDEITVKSLRAEAQIGDGPWMKLKQIHDISDYELKTERREKGVTGGAVVKKTYKALDDFMRNAASGLKTRIGYRGFVRFRIEASKQQIEGNINTKLWLIDAIGNEHGAVVSENHDVEPSEGEITYSRRHLER